MIIGKLSGLPAVALAEELIPAPELGGQARVLALTVEQGDTLGKAKHDEGEFRYALLAACWVDAEGQPVAASADEVRAFLKNRAPLARKLFTAAIKLNGLDEGKADAPGLSPSGSTTS